VILVASNDVLNIRSGPGVSHSVVASFGPTANNVMRTGPSSVVDGASWVERPARGRWDGLGQLLLSRRVRLLGHFLRRRPGDALIQNLKDGGDH
jgi:hypothetical protein